MLQRKLFLIIIFFTAVLNIVLSYPRHITKALHEATDFHSYWYSGHFVLQGINPYEAYFEDRKLQLPIYYIDGEIDSSYPVGKEELARIPANTAPMVLFTTFFSMFSWPTASFLWLLLNLASMLTIPWLTIRLWPSTASSIDNLTKLLIFSLFLSFTSAKSLIVVGQTSSLIFVLMLLSILTVDRNWILSSTALGFALSKYSLSLPLVLFFLLKKKYKVIFLSFSTQILGILILSLITKSSPSQILHGYFRMLLMHLDQPGVNITSALQIPSTALSSLLLLLLFTATVAIPTLFWVYRYHDIDIQQEISDLHILSILSIWNLLTFYHREYDMIIMILPAMLFVCGTSSNIWNLSEREKKWLYSLIYFILLWLVLPRLTILEFLANQFTWNLETLLDIVRRINTPILILCLYPVVALLYRIRPTNIIAPSS